jgi:hypothetical protein
MASGLDSQCGFPGVGETVFLLAAAGPQCKLLPSVGFGKRGLRFLLWLAVGGRPFGRLSRFPKALSSPGCSGCDAGTNMGPT